MPWYWRDPVLGDEFEARVHVGRADEAARHLEREHLHHRVEALEVGLLVDDEIEEPVAHRFERARQEVIAASMHPFFASPYFRLIEPEFIVSPPPTAKEAFDVLVAEVIGVDLGQRVVRGRGGRDHRRLDLGARFLDRVHRPVDARLQVELARRRDKERDLALPDQLDDASPIICPDR